MKWIPLLFLSFGLNQPLRAQTPDGELRPALVKSSRDFLEDKISAAQFLVIARAEHQRESFNAEEKSYLADLSERLPENLRQNLCPRAHEGLCEDSLTAMSDHWQEVPLDAPGSHVTETAPTSSWWNRNSRWVLMAAVGGLAASAWMLRDKELQISPAR
ncbi:MAG: hypothetical protein KF802_06720 [Bdellovibrionaceae bacterium]|nr:hypothetical protein [Pseudobdellovibrionaceae bacterium]MBX3034401.1 hypothetical protein [Pseudobdellovibrionaceae bacterium]